MQKSSSQGREALNARTFTLRLTGEQTAERSAESSSHCFGKKIMFLFLHLQVMLPRFTDKRNFNYLLTKIGLSPSASYYGNKVFGLMLTE